MRPVYQSCMEKGIEHIAVGATEATLGPLSTKDSKSSNKKQRHAHQNGKVKRS